MRIEIICTGDEVLTGKIVNTNFSYMTQKLEDVGLRSSGARRWVTTAKAYWLPSFTRPSVPMRSSSTAVSARPSMTCSQEVAAQAASAWTSC